MPWSLQICGHNFLYIDFFFNLVRAQFPLELKPFPSDRNLGIRRYKCRELVLLF